jgi:hypothetical protein
MTYPIGTEVVPDGSPSLTWTADPAAKKYKLLIKDSDRNILQKTWHNASDICSGGVCSIAPASPLAVGDRYTWFVKSWNYAGISSWAWDWFIVDGPAPPAVTLISPDGVLGGPPTDYVWNHEATSLRYKLEVVLPDWTVVDVAFFKAADYCTGGVCTFPAPSTLPAGDYKWSIKTWNYSTGMGPRSGWMSFTVP